MKTLIEQIEILNHPISYQPKSKELTSEDPFNLPFSAEFADDIENLWKDQ